MNTIDSSPDGLDLLHRRLSHLLGSVLNSVDLSNSELIAIFQNTDVVNMPLISRPEPDGHDLLVGAAASVVHDWWMLDENAMHLPQNNQDTDLSDEILDRASVCFELMYSQEKTNGKTVANIDLSKPLGIGLTPDGTVLRTNPGGQGELNGVQVGSQIVSVDGKAVANLNELKSELASCKAFGKLSVQIVFFSLDSEDNSDLKKKMEGVMDELSMAESVHDSMLARKGHDSIPFESLSLGEALKDVVVVRVCRLMVEIALSPEDDVVFLANKPKSVENSPHQSEENDNEDDEKMKTNENKSSDKGLQFRKGPPPETPPRASFDELPLDVVDNVKDMVEEEEEEAKMSDVDILISELVQSGDSLRQRAEKCAGDASLQDRLLCESERAYEEVLEVSPNCKQAVLGLAFISQGRSEVLKASKGFERYLGLGGKDATGIVHNALAKCYNSTIGQIGDDRAEVEFRKACQINPQNTEYSKDLESFLDAKYQKERELEGERQAEQAAERQRLRLQDEQREADRLRKENEERQAEQVAERQRLRLQDEQREADRLRKENEERQAEQVAERQRLRLQDEQREADKSQKENTTSVAKDQIPVSRSVNKVDGRDGGNVKRKSDHCSSWGEVFLLGNDSWKKDTRKFLEDTFGFVRCVDYDPLLHGASASTGSQKDKHQNLVLAYIGNAVRCGDIMIETAACIASGVHVVLVVEDVEPAAVARLRRKDGLSDQLSEKMTMVEAAGINEARASLRKLADRFPSHETGGCVVVEDATQAQFVVIDILSPVRGENDPVSPQLSTTTLSPPAPQPQPLDSDRSPDNKRHGKVVEPLELNSTGDEHLDEIVKRATESALQAMQRRHEEDLAKAIAAHEQQLRVTAKELQNDALLKERRYFRGVPTAALWETSEDRVEIIVKDRETSLLRAKRKEYIRALGHVGLRYHRVSFMK